MAVESFWGHNQAFEGHDKVSELLGLQDSILMLRDHGQRRLHQDRRAVIQEAVPNPKHGLHREDVAKQADKPLRDNQLPRHFELRHLVVGIGAVFTKSSKPNGKVLYFCMVFLPDEFWQDLDICHETWEIGRIVVGQDVLNHGLQDPKGLVLIPRY